MTKTLLTLGAGPGIALAVAHRFGRERFRPVLAARRADALAALVDDLGSRQIEAEAAVCDVADVRALAALIERVRPDVIHYNAASARFQPFLDQSADTIVPDLMVGLAGAAVTARVALPIMAARGSGAILLTGGGIALAPMANALTLSLAKAGVRALAQALFEQARASGVLVATVTVKTMVKPGSTEADGAAEVFWRAYDTLSDRWTWEASYTGGQVS